MKLTRRHALAMTAAAIGLAALAPVAGHAQDMTVRHAQGETRLPPKLDPVLVFDMAALDTLDALGVAVAGVPTGLKPPHLAKYDGPSYAKIGTFFEPDYEAVNAADPGLIIAGGRAAPKYAELSRIAPTVDMTTDQDDFLASSIANAETLGRIFGKTALVKQKADRLRASIAELKAAAATAGKGLLVLTTGGKMSAYGPGSRFGILHTEFGIQPAAPDLKVANHGQAISFEFILETNPDWLFVIDRDAAIGQDGKPARQFLDNDIVRRTTAWRKNQVVYLNGGNWYIVGGGLTALQRNVDDLLAALTRKS
ncbi:siderophore ABC transporter substrate-binding protein [Roseomonas genomospecies 6]|uniref:Iron ABC transporter substrate-binding protein n=1 Tax=Roseomonas genomospecies 6 TaxID=214106 RepID=A0A9W7KP90_9PROT|nr:siderophore ABC transporter substrate-binding protein [Roseomonas genomospecies 6]KAA0676507.1 iron ABC transporter substrate-binding protein [Roseomonas genomospecies 6]